MDENPNRMKSLQDALDGVTLDQVYPDNRSGRSTPSSMGTNPIAYGIAKLRGKIEFNDTITNNKRALTEYYESLSEQNKEKMLTVFESDSKTDKFNYIISGVTYKCMQRFYNQVAESVVFDEYVNFATKGVHELNQFIGSHDAEVRCISLEHISDIIKLVTTTNLHDIMSPILIALGMPEDMVAYLIRRPDLLQYAHSGMIGEQVTTRCQFLGAPLFVAIAMCYESYEDCDIAIHGDYVFVASKNEKPQITTFKELSDMLSVEIDAQLVTIGHTIDGCVYTKQKNGDCKAYIVANEHVGQLHLDIVRYANEASLPKAKACAAKLAYYANITQSESAAYYGLYLSIPGPCDYTIADGCYAYKMDKFESYSDYIAPLIQSENEVIVFKDARASIAVINKLLSRHMRRYYRNLSVSTDRRKFELTGVPVKDKQVEGYEEKLFAQEDKWPDYDDWVTRKIYLV